MHFVNIIGKFKFCEKIYMELKNMKQEEIKRVEVYYEQIQKLAHGLQIPTTHHFLAIVFKVGS
jgi:hypothetical protein